MCVSYLDIWITISQQKFATTVYDKRDGFGFDIVNFPYMDSNIPTNPAYGVYISQLVRLSKICCDYTLYDDITVDKTGLLVYKTL